MPAIDRNQWTFRQTVPAGQSAPSPADQVRRGGSGRQSDAYLMLAHQIGVGREEKETDGNRGGSSVAHR